MGEIVRVNDVSKHYAVKQGVLKALSNVSIDVHEGETLGIVGESGCGKSTLARLIAGLDQPTSGSVMVGGVAWADTTRSERLRLARLCQMVFQDPFSSLNPRLKVGDIVAEPLVIHGALTRGERKKEVERLLHRVGLRADAMKRYPHEFSGGQRQRIGIARALALRPRVLVADELVSALDVSVQAQILNLLADLRDELGLTLLIVSHDLQVIRWIADRVLVMYLGRVVELGTKSHVFHQPEHPYTRALIASAPRMESLGPRDDVPELMGDVPSAINPPSGCAFHPRCVLKQRSCESNQPALAPMSDGRHVACHHCHGWTDVFGV